MFRLYRFEYTPYFPKIYIVMLKEKYSSVLEN